MKFFEGYSWFKFNNFGLAPRYGLEILHKRGKRIKIKVRKFLGPIPTFVEVTGEKLVGLVEGAVLLGPLHPE